jgi:serpin B
MNLPEIARTHFPVLLLLSLTNLLPLSGRSDSLQSLVDSNTAFGLSLYSQVTPSQGNLFLSPYSISTCLAMTYAGAGGDTAQQMGQVLGFGADQAQLSSTFGELQRELETLQEEGAVELNIANALWAQVGYPFLPAFLQTARAQYQASINQADFSTQAAAASDEINNWVAQKTQNKIQNILSPGTLDHLTRLVLANAIYFKGLWTIPFAPTNTSTQPFHVSNTNQVSVALMHQPVDVVNYLDAGQFQAVELPYGSNQVSMLILLPREVDGLPQLEQQLSPDFLSAVLAGMLQRDVEIFLPRFTLESSFSLNDALAEMGMPDAFRPIVADFSGIDGATDLYITHVLHKAWAEVNEQGTEAAAATVVSIGTTAVLSPAVFRADHPFIFFIRDTQSGSLLFIGRLSEPSQAAPVKSSYQKNVPAMRPRSTSSAF